MASSIIKQNFTFTSVSSVSGYGTYISGGYCQIGDTVIVDVYFTKETAGGTGTKMLSGFPGGGSSNASSLCGINYSEIGEAPLAFRIWNGSLYPNAAHSAGNYHVFGIYKV